MADQAKPKRPIPPLDNRRLRDLALRYVGRYATTKAKLSAYLARKIGERGWAEGQSRPDLDTMMAEFSDLGYVNDAAYAQSRARAFVRRGYGKGRAEQDLYAAGVGDYDAKDARSETDQGTYASAHAFARRKKIGPYAPEIAPPELKQKQLGAFLRAGHSFALARRFINAAPGEEIEPE